MEHYGFPKQPKKRLRNRPARCRRAIFDIALRCDVVFTPWCFMWRNIINLKETPTSYRVHTQQQYQSKKKNGRVQRLFFGSVYPLFTLNFPRCSISCATYFSEAHLPTLSRSYPSFVSRSWTSSLMCPCTCNIYIHATAIEIRQQ